MFDFFFEAEHTKNVQAKEAEQINKVRSITSELFRIIWPLKTE